MARIWQGGAELNSTSNNEEVDSNSGAGTIVTTPIVSGTYAWRVNPTATTQFFRKQIYGSNQTKGGYLRVKVYISTLPDVEIQLIRFSNATNGAKGYISLTAAGLLKLFNTAGSQVGSSSGALSTGVWYVLELKCDSTAATGTLEARLDGVSFASGNNSDQGSWARILWGAITPNNASDIYFDDVALNDDQGSFQTSWPGTTGKLIRLKPSAAGDVNSMLKDGGGAGDSNNFNKCNEVNPNDATNYVIGNVLSAEDMYNVNNSGIGSSDTVNCVTIGIRCTNNVADATTAIKVQVKKTSGGTISQGSAIIPNTTTWVTDGLAGTFLPTLVMYNDPDGNPWTQSTIDTMQIGQIVSSFGTNRIYITSIWAYVDYTPIDSAPQRMLTGIGT